MVLLDLNVDFKVLIQREITNWSETSEWLKQSLTLEPMSVRPQDPWNSFSFLDRWPLEHLSEGRPEFIATFERKEAAAIWFTVQRTDSRPFANVVPWCCHGNITFSRRFFSGKFCWLQKSENSTFSECSFTWTPRSCWESFAYFLDVKHEFQRGTTKRHGKKIQMPTEELVPTPPSMWKFTRICLQHKTEDTESFSLSVRVLVPQISCFRSTHLNGKNTGTLEKTNRSSFLKPKM